MPQLHRADAGDAGRPAVPRPGLAVRDQVGRLPGRGGRADGKVRLWTRNGHDAETYFPRLLTPADVDRGPRGDRRRRGRRPRRTRPPGLLAAPGADQRGWPDRAGPCRSSTRLRPALPRRSFARRRARSRIAQAAAQARAPARPAGPFARHVDSEGVAFFEAAKAQGLEGIVAKHRRSRYEPGRRSSAWLKIKIAAGAGAGRRRLDAGGGDREGPRRGRRRRLRGRRAAVRRQGRLRVRRGARARS